jgi:GDPmannose 4,6-dehydratase
MQKGYEVHGIVRRSSMINTHRLDHIYQDPYHEDRHLFLHYGDVTDSTLLTRLLAQIQPDEVYHLAAQSHVQVSFEMPEYTAEATGVGTARMLEAIRQYGGPVRFYQASSSEMFG